MTTLLTIQTLHRLTKYVKWCLILCTLSLSSQTAVKTYKHILLDSTNVKWGDFDDPEWLRYFGVDAGDVNRDGFLDVLTGRTLFLNPGNDMTGDWRKIDLGKNVDGFMIMDVDNDEYADIIAMALPNIYWFEAQDTQGLNWKGKIVTQVPATTHTNSQGYRKWVSDKADPNFLIAGNGNVYHIEAKSIRENVDWKKTLVAQNTSDEGIGLGDIDGDGDMDIATGRRQDGADEPLVLVWFENPGDGSSKWPSFEVAKTSHPIDRIEIADVNGDGQSDIVMAEERWPGKEPDGNIFWFSPKGDLKAGWNKNHVTTQWSSNNLDVADMDADGDLDIITNEHKGPDLKTQIWSNDGEGNFTETVIDKGVEAHLGSQVFDLDKDGDLDIVSIGWDNYQKVHVWRNDRINALTANWRLVSSVKTGIATPNLGNQQTASLVIDVDKNGSMDFFITERTKAPSVLLFRFNGKGWDRHIVENDPLFIEAGSASFDIDGDGDLDVVFGGESRSNEVWWWENPFPNFEPNTPWTRRTIKKSGGNKHHDQIFGDFDGDGKHELVFWNQGDSRLVLAEIPKDVGKAEEWPMTTIYEYHNDSEMEPAVGLNGYPGWQMVNEHEGLFKCDINGDGLQDIVGGGRWFQYVDGQFIPHIIDASYVFSRSAAGQFIEGGRPEVLLVVGDGIGPLYMYEWHEWEGWKGNKKGTGTWRRIKVLERLDNGHTLDVLDFNKDGHLDIFVAEMRFGMGNPNSKVQILLGNGNGEFSPLIIAKGFGVHEGKIADLDGDGDYDVLGKPYTWKAPLLNIWLNENE